VLPGLRLNHLLIPKRVTKTPERQSINNNSAIVAFISDTTFSRREEQSAQLQWLRGANTYLVEAVKDTEQLQKNLIRYVGAENHHMHEVYNRIRVQIALTIRELEETRASGGEVMDVLELDSLKMLVDEEQKRLQQFMTELIARRRHSRRKGSRPCRAWRQCEPTCRFGSTLNFSAIASVGVNGQSN